jgi:hypothetical protein
LKISNETKKVITEIKRKTALAKEKVKGMFKNKITSGSSWTPLLKDCLKENRKNSKHMGLYIMYI